MIKAMVLLAAFLSAASGAADENAERWNLADLYPSAKAWREDAARVRSDIASFARCRGHLGDSARRLAQCLERYSELAKRQARLDVYAHELLAEDTGLAESLELAEQARVLST